MTDIDLLAAIAKRFGWHEIPGGWTKTVNHAFDNETYPINYRLLTFDGSIGAWEIQEYTSGKWNSLSYAAPLPGLIHALTNSEDLEFD